MKAARITPAGACPAGNGPFENSSSPILTSSFDLSWSNGAALVIARRSSAVASGSFHSGLARTAYNSASSDRAYDGWFLKSKSDVSHLSFD